MGVETPPFALQAGSYSAEVTRRAIYALLERGSTIGSVVGGLVGAGDMLITAGSGMQVLVAPGEGVIPGSTSATQSGYYGRVSSSSALAIAASDPTNPRVDRVVALAKDAAYSGTENLFTVAVLTGTPTSGATLGNRESHGYPAAPASSLTLGPVLVPSKASSIISGDIENVATLIKLGLMIGDANIAKGRLLIETGNAYGTSGSIPSNIEQEPSASRLTQVTVEAAAETGKQLKYEVIVGGVAVTTVKGPEGSRIPYTFLVTPGVKYKVVLSTGSFELKASYLTL